MYVNVCRKTMILNTKTLTYHERSSTNYSFGSENASEKQEPEKLKYKNFHVQNSILLATLLFLVR